MGNDAPGIPGDSDLDGVLGDAASLIDGLPDDLLRESNTDVSERRAEDKAKRKDLVQLLFKRIALAKKTKKKWEEHYEVDRSSEYVRGFQRPITDEKDAQDENKYQINKILASLKAKIPNIFYYNPYMRIRASRSREDTPQQMVTQRAQLLQDTINSIIRNPNTRFKPECLLSLKEAQWAFGVVEVGYSADWGENPYTGKPPLVESEDARDTLEEIGAIPEEPETDIDRALQSLDEVPHTETFYVKYIPARQFFVASNDRSSTEAMDWVAYWEWMYVEDVKRSSYENTDGLKPTGEETLNSGYDSDLAPMSAHMKDKDKEHHKNAVIVWKLWDLRTKTRYVLAEGHEDLLKETPFTYLPVFTLRMEVFPGEWYPIPPIYSELTEQDETNDAREYLRVVRKGTRPRFLYDKNAFDPDELEKLESDDFFPFVGVKNQNMQAVVPISQPSMAETALRTLSLADQGFTEQSGVSPTSRLTRSSGGAPTATEIEALTAKGSVRDSYEQQEVADWLGDIGRGIIMCAIEKMTLPKWITINSDPRSPFFPQDAQMITEQWLQITYEDVTRWADSFDWDVTVDVESMSPTSESQHASKVMQFLNLLSSPGVGGLLSLSMPLLKLMLMQVGIRSDSDQRAILDALQKRQMMMAAQAGAIQPGAQPPKEPGVAPMPGGGQPNPPGAPEPPGNGTPPPGGPQPSAPPGRPS